MQKQRKVHFLFSFGKHSTKEDWFRAKAAIDKFKPHVFAAEEAEWDGSCQEIQKVNAEIREARTDSAKKEKMVQLQHALISPDMREFSSEQLRFLIESDNILYYTLEDNWSDDFFARARQYDELDVKAFISLRDGKVREALKLLLASHTLYAEEMAERNFKVAAGTLSHIETMEYLFPGLANADPLRIFVRFGDLHSGAYNLARMFNNDRPNTEISRVFDDGLPFHYEIPAWPTRALIYKKPVEESWLLFGFLWNLWPESWENFVAAAKHMPAKSLIKIFEDNPVGGQPGNIQEWAGRIVSEAKKIASE